MKTIGTLISLIGIIIYRDDWRRVQIALNGVYERKQDVPEIAQRILILGEDHRFFKHQGVDIISICRALWRRLSAGIVEGGSTLEQQLIRVVTGRYERTFQRKFREVCLATLVTRVIPKGEVPSVYLSYAYFGWSMNGFRQACGILGVDPQYLTVTQACEIISRIKYPQSRTFSLQRFRLIRRRKNYLLAKYSQLEVHETRAEYLSANHEAF